MVRALDVRGGEQPPSYQRETNGLEQLLAAKGNTGDIVRTGLAPRNLESAPDAGKRCGNICNCRGAYTGYRSDPLQGLSIETP